MLCVCFVIWLKSVYCSLDTKYWGVRFWSGYNGNEHMPTTHTDIIYIHTHAYTSLTSKLFLALIRSLCGCCKRPFLDCVCVCSEGLVDVCKACVEWLYWSMGFLSANQLICSLEAHEDAALEILVVCVFRLICNWWISRQWRSAVDIYKKHLKNFFPVLHKYIMKKYLPSISSQQPF